MVRERARLGHFIRGQVRNVADAEDILQEVLLEFYLAADAVESARMTVHPASRAPTS